MSRMPWATTVRATVWATVWATANCIMWHMDGIMWHMTKAIDMVYVQAVKMMDVETVHV